MATGQANALELGDIQVQSTLGQPLRASIAFALAPNESLQEYCVSVSGAASSSGLPTIGNTRVTIADGQILLTSTRAIREPIVSTQLRVNCPYTPNITREYMMFIDPSDIAETRQLASASAPAVTSQPRTSLPATVNRPAPRSSASRAAVLKGSDYRVQVGETLSQIAQRIEGRQLGLWPAVNALFEANPDAFINNDPNKLKAGSVLMIPDFVGDEIATFAAREPAAQSSAPAETTQPVSSATDAAEAPVTQQGPETEAASAPESAALEETPQSMVVEPESINAANEVAETSGERIVIPDTQLESPPQASETPNRSVARIQPAPAAATESSPSNWLIAALGGGVALIALLLLFGRQFRQRFGSTPVGGAVADSTEQDHDTLEMTHAGLRDIADDSPTDRNLTLDAELDFGHDLDGGVDVDFSKDFGNSGTTRLDVELPAGSDTSDTDIIPTSKVEASSILESEILPDDDDYDMSVIMDVTKMPSPDDVTEKDLKAIEVESLGQDTEDGEYTLEKEVDYDILEKDYQDELSATQALNMEIEKAARELSERLEKDDAETTSVKIADVSEMEGTAELYAQNDEILSDLDDTNVNEALQLPDDETAILDQSDDTSELPLNENTVEMQRRSESDEDTVDVMTSDGDHTVEIITRDDDTVEMEIEGGRVDTKNRRKG